MSAQPWLKALGERWRLQGRAGPATDMFGYTGDALARPDRESGADRPDLGRRAD